MESLDTITALTIVAIRQLGPSASERFHDRVTRRSARSPDGPSVRNEQIPAPSSPNTKPAARYPPHGQLITAQSKTRQRELTGTSISRLPSDAHSIREVEGRS